MRTLIIPPLILVLGAAGCASIDPVERAKCWTYAASKAPSDADKGQIMADQAKAESAGQTVSKVLATVAERVTDPQALDSCGVYLGQLAQAGSAQAAKIKAQMAPTK